MPFSEVAASCVGMAVFVRVDAILKRLLPMMSEVSVGGVSLSFPCSATVLSNDRHRPANVSEETDKFRFHDAVVEQQGQKPHVAGNRYD